MVKFTKHELAILRALYRYRRPMSISEIANKAKVSWKTAEKYIKKWNTKGVVSKVYGKSLWKLEFDILYSTRKK